MSEKEQSVRSRSVPSPRMATTTFFLGVWLGGWWSVLGVWAWDLLSDGEVTYIPGPGDAVVSGLFLFAFTMAGLPQIRAWVWNALGRETLSYADGRLTVRYTAFGVPIFRSRSWDGVLIEGVRSDVPAERPSGYFLMPYYVAGRGSVVFDYGKGTVRVAVGLIGKPEETRDLVTAVRGWLAE